MIDALLIQLLLLVDRLPAPAASERRGRPFVYPETLSLKALLIMTIRRLYRPSEFLAVLKEVPMLKVRALLTDEHGRFPSRRTWERRLARLPESLPARISLIGKELVTQIHPWTESGRAVALDSTVFRALGGVWHKTHREAGVVPHTRIDTEATWTKSGYHGWVYGWKLHVAITVASVWIPVAACLRPANEADNVVAEGLLPDLPAETRFVLGDRHYNAPNIREARPKAFCSLLPSTEPIPIPTPESRCAASSTSFARLRMRISTSSTKTSSAGTTRSPRRA